MLNSNYIRTTISIPEELLLEAKKKALMDRKSLKTIFYESLNIYLGKNMSIKKNMNISSLFGKWGKGTSGKEYLKKIRSKKAEIERDEYYNKIWKKF